MTDAASPFGATHHRAATRFHLWAPNVSAVSLEIEGRAAAPMPRDADGGFTTELDCPAGAAYRYRVRPDLAVPDPASREQAGDVHDASLVVDPTAYDWKHPNWAGRPWHEAVVYELHVGLLGGFRGVAERLPELAALGVTVVELMPIADFPGPRNWGYDGVLPYTPDATYGTPSDLKHLIDAAHGLGLMVMLDVVYNHFGPDGNYLGTYADAFYRHDRATPWGDAIDFRSPQVRRFFIDNAVYWLTEYRLDGLRLDAVHAIGDSAFLEELAQETRAAVAHRPVHLVMENEMQDAALLRARGDAPGFDAQWADDMHHCLHVLLTGEREGYYADYADAPAARLAHCLAEGFDYQGQPSMHRDGRPRGTRSAHLPTTCFVVCLQNHDQVGNRALGERLTELTNPDSLRAATLLLLLVPQIPLLFMGQEWGCRTPFLYFASFSGELADAVREGRRCEFAHFTAFSDPAQRHLIPDPNDPATFRRSVPDFAEREWPECRAWLDLHRALLGVRRSEIVPRIPGTRSLGAVALGTTGVSARWSLGDAAVLHVAANFGAADLACPMSEGRVLFAVGTPAADGRLGARSAFASVRDRA